MNSGRIENFLDHGLKGAEGGLDFVTINRDSGLSGNFPARQVRQAAARRRLRRRTLDRLFSTVGQDSPHPNHQRISRNTEAIHLMD